MSSALLTSIGSGAAGGAAGSAASGAAATGGAAAGAGATSSLGQFGAALGSLVSGGGGGGGTSDIGSGVSDGGTGANDLERSLTSSGQEQKGGFLGTGMLGNDQYNPNPSSYAPQTGNQQAQAAMPKSKAAVKPIALQMLDSMPLFNSQI